MKRLNLAALFLLFILLGSALPVGAVLPWLQTVPEQRQFDVAPLAVSSTLSGLDGFNPIVNGQYVITIAVQQDGKILVGGDFWCIGKTVLGLVCDPQDGFLRNNLTRFNTDGTIDATFTPNPNGVVEAISVNKSDGSFIVAGDFTSIAGVAHNYIAKFNADGSIITGFTAGVGGVGAAVYAVQFQSDNKILIGGSFSTVTTVGGTFPRNNLARLNADGSLDATFDPNVNNDVYAVDVQSDGHIIIGGIFTEVGSSTPATRTYVARLNSNGSVPADNFATLGITSTDPFPVHTVKVHSSGDDVLIGGKFTITTPGINNLVRTGFDGVIKTTFKPQPNESVETLFVKMNGEILAGGLFSAFTQPGNPVRNQLALIQNDQFGMVDPAFSPGVDDDGEVYSVVEQSDGKILAGGIFGSIDGKARSRIARLYSNLYNGGSDVPIAGSTTVTTASMNIASLSCPIVGLKVVLKASHPAVGELSFSLTHAGRGPSSLIDAHTCSVADIDTILDDEAAVIADTQCAGTSPAINGIFQPSTQLSFFDGVTSFGNWTLTINNSGSQTGTLNGWGLVVNCASSLTVTKNVPVPDGVSTASVTSSPPGFSCGSACSGSSIGYFLVGSSVSLAGTATGNWDLDRWSGACTAAYGSSGFPACVITTDGDKTVGAEFVEITDFDVPVNVYSGFSAFFTDKSKHSPATWLWDFGDGETSTFQNPGHAYSTPGDKTVLLHVNGAASRFHKSKVITVGTCTGSSLPVKLLPSGTAVATISEAYQGAPSGSTIAMLEGAISMGTGSGGVIAIDKNIVLDGGYFCGFVNNSATSSAVVINADAVSLEGVAGVLTVQ
ncbi:MAG: PKD domain-containing protein [Thermodesulfovibrionales bacterium]